MNLFKISLALIAITIVGYIGYHLTQHNVMEKQIISEKPQAQIGEWGG